MSDLTGKVALVTGAGQGIGRGIALALADRGASVAVVGRTESKLKGTVDEIHGRGGEAIAIACDVKNEDEVTTAVATTVDTFGHLDVLVNNAQEYNFGSLLDIPLDLVEAGWRSGAIGTLLFMRAAHSHLAKARGSVVNVSSTAAVASEIAGVGAYSAVKAAIDSLTRAAAMEWSGDGIRVNSIMPIARTPALEGSFDAFPGLEDGLTQSIPMKRLGDAESDIGPVVAFLAGSDASYITGTTISADGGTVRLR